MSGKFMRIKKIIVPTITMVIIASQLMGCAAASQSELLQMINQGDAIEIEVATPINEEQGEESSLEWEQLALLTTNPDLRKSWDDTLNITPTDTGKNGILYVDAEGNNEPNNTLRVALHNREFVKYLENESDTTKLAEASAGNYVDLESDDIMKSVYMGINGYFNLLPDSSTNYANPDSTLQRNEFMAMVFRAETPVQELEADTAFSDAVGASDYNIYAQGVAQDSYLDLASKSLNNLTANGTITRAEAIYTIVSRYFADDLKNVDTNGVTFTDAKDGGNIAEQQKFIEDGTQKDYWKSYELTYALQNPDNGLPTDLFKALAVAKDKGLITSETRWDEALTKSEAIELLVTALMQETGVTEFNAKQGIIEGYEVTPDTTTETTTTEEVEEEANLAEEVVVEAETQDEIEYDNYLQEAENEHKKDTSDIVESDIESLNKTMYAQGNVNTRSGPSQDFEKIGGLAVNQEVKVTGQSKETGWYEIEVNGSKQYVSNKFLADSKITVTTNTDNTTNTGNVDSNTGSNDILPGGNDNWSGSDGDAASFFNSLPSVGSAPSGHHAGGEGIHAE